MNFLKLSHKSTSKTSFALDVFFLLITEVYSKTTTSVADSGLVKLLVMTKVLLNTKSKLNGSYTLNR